MTQTTFKVSREFIVAGHKDACSGWKKTLETKFPEAFQTPAEAPKFKMGDRISGIDTKNNEYMLAQVGDSIINLINLSNGNRWTHMPVHVDAPTKITLSELKQLVDSKTEIVVNGKTVSLKPVPKRVKQSFEVDATFIREAASAASSEWTSKIKAEFPKAFSAYLKFTDDRGHSMPIAITDVQTRIQSDTDVQICVAKGYAEGLGRKDLMERALCIEGGDVENVELIRDESRGRWYIAIKTK